MVFRNYHDKKKNRNLLNEQQDDLDSSTIPTPMIKWEYEKSVWRWKSEEQVASTQHSTTTTTAFNTFWLEASKPAKLGPQKESRYPFQWLKMQFHCQHFNDYFQKTKKSVTTGKLSKDEKIKFWKKSFFFFCPYSFILGRVSFMRLFYASNSIHVRSSG